MTVRGNLAYPLEMAKLNKTEINRKVMQVAATLHLTELLDRYPKALSGGQRQRVAIGRAIIREPDIFLFDEPLSNLDAELRLKMRIEIAKLHESLGSTMIYVTHDQLEAMTLADRIVVLRDGRIEQVGDPQTIYHDPDNIFVAGFIGSPKMNFLTAQVSATHPGEVQLTIPELGIESLVCPLHSEVSEGTTLKLGIRPEHFVTNPDRNITYIFRATVSYAERLGHTNYLYFDIGQESLLVVEARESDSIQAHQSLSLALNPQKILLFTQQGERIR
jgi:multiple sugar transport system ATP-binding protein